MLAKGLIFLCFVPLLSVAQNTFFKEYNYLDFDSKQSIQIGTANQLNGNYVVAGIKYDSAFARNYPFLAFLDKEGDKYSQVIDSTYFTAYYHQNCIKDNYIYIAGAKYDSHGFDANVRKIIVKYTSTGELIWSKPFGDSTHFLLDNAVIKIFSTETGIVVFGTTDGGAGTTDSEATFFDDDGNVLFRKLYSTEESLHYTDFVFDVSQQDDGYVLLMRSIAPNDNLFYFYHLIKIDLQGNEMWRKDITNYAFPGHDLEGKINIPTCLSNHKENSTVVAFFSKINKSYPSKQIILAKFDFNGDLLEAKVSLTDSNEYDPNRLLTNKEGELFLFGSKTGDSTQLYDVFVAKYTSEIDLIWNKSWGYEQGQLFNGVSVLTDDGGVLIGGSIFRLYTPVGFQFYLVKTDCMGNTEWDNSSCYRPNDEDVTLFGNPVSDVLTVQFPNHPDDENFSYWIVDAAGKIIMKGNESGKILNVQVSGLSDGLYFLRTDGEVTKDVLKFVKN